MIRILARSAARYFASHRLQLVMSVVGVAVGVAMVTGIDLATRSASEAFRLSTEQVAGPTTHFLTGPRGVIETEQYRRLRVDLGVQDASPVIEGYVRSEAGTFRLVGVEPFVRAPGRELAGFPDPGILLAMPSVVISEGALARLDAGPRDTLALSVAGRSFRLPIAGVVRPADPAARQAWGDLLVTDIATAQVLMNQVGMLTRIDLVTSDNEAEDLAARLGPGTVLGRPEARTETLSQMTAAFETNLQALSYLALVVGLFLIFNIMSFSVVQRRPVYSRLRATGVRAATIRNSVLLEAGLIGLIGTGLGLAGGVWLGDALIALVSRAINDLYFVVNVQQVRVAPADLVKSGVVGLGASLLSAWIPARNAAAVPITDALARSDAEDRFAARVGAAAWWGLISCGAGVLVLWLPTGVAGGYVGLLLVIAGFSLLCPAAIRGLAAIASRTPLPLTAQMAFGGIRTHLSRTAVAIAALAVSVAAAVGVGVMVDSFRGTVEDWLGTTLRADLYVRAPASVVRLGGGEVDAAAIAFMRNLPEVDAAYGVRRVDVKTRRGDASLVVIEHGPESRPGYRFSDSVSEPWSALERGEVFVSEPYAFRNGVVRGDTLFMQTPAGEQAFPIAAVYIDYGSDVGVVMMDRGVYEARYGDRAFNGLALYLVDGADPEAVADQLRTQTSGMQALIVQSNTSLLQASLDIFDRTFAITWVLRALALAVAIIGVISALSAIQIERGWEFAVQRALGFRRSRLRRILLLETAAMGLLAGVLAIPLGLALAAGLVFVINRRSFGWTLEFSIDPWILAQSVLLSVAAALVAGLIPAFRLRSQQLASRLKLRA